MKIKFLLITIALCFFSFTSCSSDDDSSGNFNPSVEDILEKWRMDESKVNDEIEEGSGEIMEFKSNGEVIGFSDDGDVTGNYSLNADKLTINFPGGKAIFTILKLTESKMELFVKDDVDDEEGLDDVVYYFTRVE